MGTSSSGKGPGPNAPLVPSWADPLPQPEPPDPDDTEPDESEPDETEEGPPESEDAENKDQGQEPSELRVPVYPPVGVPPTLRLTGFKRRLGNAVERGPCDRSEADLTNSLQSYARATGGGVVAARRLGSAIATGGRVYSLFSAGSAVGPDGRVLDLASLAGQETRVVIDRIVDVLVARNGDREKISAALKDALPQALSGVQTFNPAAIDRDVMVNLMVAYTQECVFQQVISDSDRAFQRNTNTGQVGEMEGQLHALVVSVVGEQLAPLFETDAVLSEAQAKEAQAEAIRRTWSVWERRRR